MTAAALDTVVADRPVAMADDSAHSQWVNSAMLRLLGITKETADPDGGAIERLADGTPSVEPDLPLEEQLEAAVQERARLAGPPLHCRSVKLFADGVIEAHTAWLNEPYADRPGYRGEHIWEPQALAQASVAAARAGFQLHYHAIGDAATAMSLDAIAAARAATGNTRARDMITHLQLVDPRDIARFAALGVTAVPQPYWFGREPVFDKMYVPFLGVERTDHQYPMRSFWDHRVPVASASDYPVSPPPNPLLAIQRGVLRRGMDTPEPCEELWPEEAVGVEQMIESFTINGAYANFLEAETGSIEVGKSADLAVLSDNILETSPESIHHAEVLLTVFRGAPVHATGPFAGLALD